MLSDSQYNISMRFQAEGLGVSRVRVHYKTKKSSPRYEDLDSHASSRRSVVHVRQMYLS